MKVDNLSLHEGGPNKSILRIQVTHRDLTETTANTAQVIELFDVVDGDLVYFMGRAMGVAFQDASDAAFNSTTLSYGDGGSATRFVNAAQGNENGTEVHWTVGNPTGYAYVTTDTVDLTVGSMTGKSLVNIDTGCEISFWEIHHMAQEVEQYK